MTRIRILLIELLSGLIVISSTASMYAQVPEYDLLRTQVEKDSLATVEYPYIFPLFGENIVRKGFDLPLPIGISISYYQQSMDVIIDSVALGLGGAGFMPLTFVDFEKVTNEARNYNARLDLWLFPFLNIYGMLGYAESDAAVTLNAPFDFETAVSFNGWSYGGGAILAVGLQGFWITANGNLTWTDMEDYYDPVRATVLSFRLGRTLRIIKNTSFQIWLGAMHQDPESKVTGKFLLYDVVTNELMGYFQNYQQSQWYNDLTPQEQQFVDTFIEIMQQGPTGLALDYEVVQNPEQRWNMLAGAQVELSKKWYIQAEAGFLGSRTSLMMNLNYRLPL